MWPMQALLLRPPPVPANAAAGNDLLPSAASGRPPPLLLRARRMAAGPPPPSAAADFPAGPVLDGGSPTGTRPRRRRSVAGVDQDDLLDPGALADPDSSFCDINGVKFHHKVYTHQEEEDSASGSGAGVGVPVGQI